MRLNAFGNMIMKINATENPHQNSKTSVSETAAGPGNIEVYWKMGSATHAVTL
jgi:hypothetical protein